MGRSRKTPLAILGALAFALTAIVCAAPGPADAVGCVRIVSGKFDAPGDDNQASHLNGEYVRIKNYCTFAKAMGSWRLHDYGAKNTYVFASTFKLGAGASVYVFSGRGTNTVSKRYWGRSYGAVWNNAPPERAYLRSASRALLATWSPYDAPSPSATPTPKPTPEPTPTPAPPPVASFTYIVSGLVVSFDGSSSIRETTYAWDFGDGEVGSGASPSHTYAPARVYQVTLTVTGPGGSDSDSRTITIP